MTPLLSWDDHGAYEGDSRRLGRCGQAVIGAIFLPSGRAKYVRWRMWCSVNMNPVDGTSKSVEGAKEEIERRFSQFVDLAGLERKSRAPAEAPCP